MSILRAIRKKRLEYKLRLLGGMLDAIEQGFIRNNVPRRERRKFWFDFIKTEQGRKEMIREVLRNA